jgi:fructokinase
LGGAPLNFAFFAKELGAEAYAISAVGMDSLGDETLEIAGKTCVDLSYVQRNDLPTSRVLVTLDENGIPAYEIVEGVAWDSIECTDEALELVKDASVICWGSLAQRSKKSRESVLAMLAAAPESCLKVFDINIRQHYYSREVIEASLEYADILKLNEDELPLVADMLGLTGTEKEVVSALIQKYALTHLIYTHGADFSEVYAADGAYSHIPTPKVKVADTVGAGDSFTAVFVTSLLQGKSLGDAHAKAVEVSAYVCTQNGAINPLT